MEIMDAKYDVDGKLISGLQATYNDKNKIEALKPLTSEELSEINKNNEISFLKHYAAAIPVLTETDAIYELKNVKTDKNGLITGGEIYDKTLKPLNSNSLESGGFRSLFPKEIERINKLLTKKSILPHVRTEDLRAKSKDKKIPINIPGDKNYTLTDISINPDGTILSAKQDGAKVPLTKNELSKINQYLNTQKHLRTKLKDEIGRSQLKIKVESEYEVTHFEKSPSGNYTQVEVIKVSDTGQGMKYMLSEQGLLRLNNDLNVRLDESRRKGLHPTKAMWDQYTYDSLEKVDPKYAEAFANQRCTGSSLTDHYLENEFQGKIAHQHPDFGGVSTDRRLLDINAPVKSPLLNGYNSRLLHLQNQDGRAITDHLGLESVYQLNPTPTEAPTPTPTPTASTPKP